MFLELAYILEDVRDAVLKLYSKSPLMLTLLTIYTVSVIANRKGLREASENGSSPAQ